MLRRQKDGFTYAKGNSSKLDFQNTNISKKIDLPHVGGQIIKISGTTITTQDRKGTYTIQVSSSKVFVNDQTNSSISLSDLRVGENIHAEGTLNSDGSLAALLVHLAPQMPAGTSPAP